MSVSLAAEMEPRGDCPRPDQTGAERATSPEGETGAARGTLKCHIPLPSGVSLGMNGYVWRKSCEKPSAARVSSEVHDL